MVGRVGRQVRFFFGGESPGDEILGVREKSLDCKGEAIDITSGEDAGIRTLIANLAAQSEVDIGISGVTKDERLKTAWYAGNLTQIIRLEYPNNAVITGTFFLSSYKETEPYKDASTFEAALVSSGPVVFTPGS